MGLFDWFKSAATASGEKLDIASVKLDEGESAEIAGLNFQDAVAAHQRWKARLQACIAGTSSEKLDPAVVGRDDQCALGKWIHGQGTLTFGTMPAFSTLKIEHAQFHRIAGEVLSDVYAGRTADAQTKLGGPFASSSVTVQGLLANLFMHVRRG